MQAIHEEWDLLHLQKKYLNQDRINMGFIPYLHHLSSEAKNSFPLQETIHRYHKTLSY